MRASRAALAGLAIAWATATSPATREATSEPPSAENGVGPKEVPDEPYPADLRARVRRALDRGAAWLRLRQLPSGSFAGWGTDFPVGPTALSTLAMLKCGVPATDEALVRAFQWMRAHRAKTTYEVALVLMALAAKYDSGADPFAAETLDAQGHRVVRRVDVAALSKDDRAWLGEGVDFLVRHELVSVRTGGGTSGRWSYPELTPGNPLVTGDLSNTQYALLGLKAAALCGVEVPASVWTTALVGLLDGQATTGPPVELRANEVRGAARVEWREDATARGFDYQGDGRGATGSMTTAGAAGLMICQSELWNSAAFPEGLRARTQAGIRDALAWMQARFTVEQNPAGEGENARAYHLYYLYGLERMGILGHVRFLGTHDWYSEGAERILSRLRKDGALEGNHTVDTCFALLFLRRGSFRTANPVITPTSPEGPAGGATPGAPAPK